MSLAPEQRVLGRMRERAYMPQAMHARLLFICKNEDMVSMTTPSLPRVSSSAPSSYVLPSASQRSQFQLRSERSSVLPAKELGLLLSFIQEKGIPLSAI